MSGYFCQSEEDVSQAGHFLLAFPDRQGHRHEFHSVVVRSDIPAHGSSRYFVSQFLRYCGRRFTDFEVESIGRLIADNPGTNRAELSRLVCELLGWRRPDGRLKDMSCRVAMIRM